MGIVTESMKITTHCEMELGTIVEFFLLLFSFSHMHFIIPKTNLLDNIFLHVWFYQKLYYGHGCDFIISC